MNSSSKQNTTSINRPSIARGARTVSLYALALLALATTTAEATAINVPNASFENPTTPTGGDGAPIPGWVFNSQSGNLYGTAALSQGFISEGAASGNNYAFMFNDVAGKTDTITSAASLGIIAANTDYTLTVAVGNVGGSDSVSNHYPGNVSFCLLANGIAFATDTVPNGTVPDATFEDFSLTFQTPSSGAIIGENLEIQLASLPTSGPGSGPAFDNVTLNATSIAAAPEPSTCALLLGGLLILGWLIRGRMRSAKIMACASSLTLTMTLAHATLIAIPNASFESPSTYTGTGTTTGLIPGWTDTLGVGDGYGTETITSYFATAPAATSGNNFAALANYKLDTAATLTSAASLGLIAASTQYILTVAIGNVSAPDTIPYGAPGPISFSLLGDGTPLATQVVPNGTVPNATFEDFTLTYDSPSSGTVIGDDLTIQLEAMPQSTALYLAAFDNVTLDATPEDSDPPAVPEPSTRALLIPGALALGWYIRRKLAWI